MMDTLRELPMLSKLRDTLTEQPPFCSGVLALPSDQLQMYFGERNAQFVDFTKSAEKPDATVALADACQPAAFGKGQETVLDETYRKAGKMDASAFMTRFDVERSGLMRIVQTGLLSGEQEEDEIRAELHKLNVYGEGAFFKAHQDTPRAVNMFGSLVVVLPAPHEGGELVLRQAGKEWKFDATALLAGRTDAIAYVAFFSDVEHEVLPVRSGHRVTLTYNLYYGTRAEDIQRPPSGLLAHAPPYANQKAIADALSALLEDASFLPIGGTLGFGLRHKYPFPTPWTDDKEDPLNSLKRWLKGGDDALFRACSKLGLSPYLRLYFSHSDTDMVLGRMVDIGGGYTDWDGYGHLEHTMMEYGQGAEIRSRMFAKDGKRDGGDGDGYEFDVYWVTETEKWNGLSAQYLAMGNEATLDHFYVSLCLLVLVGPPGTRVPSQRETTSKRLGGRFITGRFR